MFIKYHSLIISTEQTLHLKKCCVILKKIRQNQFLLATLYLGRLADIKMCNKIHERFKSIKATLSSTNYTLPHNVQDNLLPELVYFDIQYLLDSNDKHETERSATLCVQTLLTVDIFLRPWEHIGYFVSELLTFQRLKKFSNAQLYYEIIRSGLMSVSNNEVSNYNTIWGAFIFFRVPQIIKYINSMKKGNL